MTRLVAATCDETATSTNRLSASSSRKQWPELLRVLVGPSENFAPCASLRVGTARQGGDGSATALCRERNESFHLKAFKGRLRNYFRRLHADHSPQGFERFCCCGSDRRHRHLQARSRQHRPHSDRLSAGLHGTKLVDRHRHRPRHAARGGRDQCRRRHQGPQDRARDARHAERADQGGERRSRADPPPQGDRHVGAPQFRRDGGRDRQHRAR